MRAFRILLVLLCASTLAFAAAGCGGGGGSSYSGAKPEAWAANVCGGLSDWAQGLQAGSRQLSADLRKAKSIPEVKSKFVAFIENAQSSADTMIAKVKTAGPPAVKDGDKLQQDLEAGLQQARESFARAVLRAKALPTNNPRAFSDGVTQLGSDVEKELTAIGETFNNLGGKYKDKTLDAATSKEPACGKLSGSSSG
jgi:hypothetical protein